MSDDRDIVERLLESADGWDECGNDENAALDRAAVAEIERLREDNVHLDKMWLCAIESVVAVRAETKKAAADEIEQMRAALEKIAAMDEICVTDFDGVNGWAHQWIARAALAKG